MTVSFACLPSSRIPQEDCGICHDLLSAQQVLAHPAGTVEHCFHRRCIIKWTDRQLAENIPPQCPSCCQTIKTIPLKPQEIAVRIARKTAREAFQGAAYDLPRGALYGVAASVVWGNTALVLRILQMDVSPSLLGLALPSLDAALSGPMILTFFGAAFMGMAGGVIGGLAAFPENPLRGALSGAAICAFASLASRIARLCGETFKGMIYGVVAKGMLGLAQGASASLHNSYRRGWHYP